VKLRAEFGQFPNVNLSRESSVPRQNERVCVLNRTRERFVATNVVIADSYFSRLIGLLGKTKRWAHAGQGLWIVPSHGVHTMGMLFPIDLIFLDRDKNVIHVEEHVKPFRISRVSLRTYSVLELPAHTVFRTGTCVGDQLEFLGTENGDHPKAPSRSDH
jgi:uncharacterized membrane protein (UPF0127 family)